jgi:hypothetical protein
MTHPARVLAPPGHRPGGAPGRPDRVQAGGTEPDPVVQR